ncbi:BEN domain-containing protein 5 [Holothuria leucospilota]|uniref:BEN domain-containing protein 5 n=1 Tax=Holothuria leucospilota TaxID=206669 RepID=A0A9Q0Y9U5_HOLLE|nr:BEN domain-containing protein 5 [Holothuria leucospilota]
MAPNSVKYAYVKFLKDQERDYVPVESISNFKPKHSNDFDSKKAYMVTWRDLESDNAEEGEYKAQILMLGASEEELEKKVSSTRVRVPKILDTSVEFSSDDEIASERTAVAKERKEKKVQQSSLSRSLGGILAEKVAKKKSSPLFQNPSSNFSETSATACTCGTLAKYDAAKKRYREAEAENLQLKSSLKKLKEDEATYLHLNRELQSQLLEQLKGKASLKSKGEMKQPSHSVSVIDSDSEVLEDKRSSMKYATEDGKVCIGKDIYISELQWDLAEAQKTNSLFVKNLAVSVWGTAVLKNRSVEGRVCPRFKDQREARSPLSPNKLNAIKG